MKQKCPKEMWPNEVAEHLQSDDWESCYQTAEHFYAQGVYQEAFSWYKKASVLPDCNPIIFFELGYLFQHGEGVDSDNIEALKWYEKAASLDVPQAMYNLAYFYQNGIVVDQDIQRAAQLLRDATSLMDRLQLERDSYGVWKAEYDAQLAEIQKEVEEKRIHSENLELRNRELDIELLAVKRECQRLEQEVARHKRTLEESEKWKAEYDVQLVEIQRGAEEKRIRSENLELQNRELDIELLAVKQECQRLEQEAAQYKRALKESEKQCGIFATRTESTEAALRKEQETRKEVEVMASTRQTQMEEWLRASNELITNLVKKHNESFESVQSSYTVQIDRLQRAYETDFTELQRAKEQLGGQNADLSKKLDRKISELSVLQETLQQLQMQLEQEQKKKRFAFILAGIFGVLTVILFI